VRHAGQLLLGAALEVIPALLHLLAGALPAGDAVDLGRDAVPHTPPLRHAHPTALRAVELRVVGAHLADQDLVLLEREARLAQPGGLLRLARRRRGHGAPRRDGGLQEDRGSLTGAAAAPACPSVKARASAASSLPPPLSAPSGPRPRPPQEPRRRRT
uniref:Uncharacterized protein n=2 Tax=Canis lupus TaxID=9612 RepID=A0A8C0RZW4_CANLF